MRIVLDLSGIADDGQLAKAAASVLDTVVEHNRYLLNLSRKNGVRIPPLFESGVRFRNEPWAGSGLARRFGPEAPPLEEFCHLGIVLARGWGDCSQICAWRVAELHEGWPIDAKPERAGFRIYCRRLGEDGSARLYHVQTRRAPLPRFDNDPSAGAIEDTSRLLDY